MKVLVDTCVWARAFRVKPSLDDPHLQELKRLCLEGRPVLIGPIRQEVLSGAAPRERFELLRTRLRDFPDLSLQSEDYDRAAEFYHLLRSRGEQASNVDLLICSAATGHEVSIFTVDGDFQRLAKLLTIDLHSPRPA